MPIRRRFSEEIELAQCRRDYFRIRARLPVRYRSLLPGERETFLANLASEEPVPLSALPPGLVQWLDRLEKKLDCILSCIDARASVPLTERDRCDITLSGSGIAVARDEEEQIGEEFLIEVLLPGIPARRVLAVGKVVDNLKAEELAEGVFVAFTFVEIDEKDRDAIIAYVQDVQRAELRAAAAQSEPR